MFTWFRKPSITCDMPIHCTWMRGLLFPPKSLPPEEKFLKEVEPFEESLLAHQTYNWRALTGIQE